MALLDEIKEAGGLLETFRGGKGPGAQLGRGSAGVLAIRIAGLTLVSANQILLARLLGVEGYGQYIYVITLVNVLAIAGLLGLNTATVRFVAEYAAMGSSPLLTGFLRRSLQVIVTSSGALAAAGAVVVLMIADELPRPLATTLLVGLPLVLLVNVLELKSSVLAGLNRVLAARVFPDVLLPALFGLAIALTWWTSAGALDAPDAMVANVVATVCVLIACVAMARRAVAYRVGTRPVYRSQEWLRTSWPMFLTAGFSVVLTRTDVVLLGMLRSTTEAGVYAVAGRIADLVTFGLAAVGTVGAPLYAHYWSQKEHSRLQRTARISVLLASLMAVPVATVIISLGPWLLGIFGQQFRIAYVPLIVLCFGQVGNAVTGTVGLLLSMTGQERQVARVLGVAAVANIALDLLVIPICGIVGAAAVTASVVVLRNIALVLIAKRLLDVDATVYSVRA